MRDAVILSAVRTPIGRFLGGLTTISAPRLGSIVIAEAVRRAGISHEAYGLLEGTPAQILHDFPWKPNDRETGEKLISSRRGTERALVDNPWQLPGEFAIGRDGRIVHAHRYQYCEDFPPKTVLLGAIAAAGR